MSEPSEQEIERVAAALKDDITWTVQVGPGWNPARIALVEQGRFVTDSRPLCGGVCAVAAHVLRHGVPAILDPSREEIHQRFDCNVKAAAFSLGVDKDWLDEVCSFVAVDDEGLEEDDGDTCVDGKPIKYLSAWDLSRELRQFGHDATRAHLDSKATP